MDGLMDEFAALAQAGQLAAAMWKPALLEREEQRLMSRARQRPSGADRDALLRWADETLRAAAAARAKRVDRVTRIGGVKSEVVS